MIRFLSLILIFSACGKQGDIPKTSPVIAFVNGVSIKEDELRSQLNLEKTKFDDKTYREPARFDRLKNEMLDRLIRNRVIIEWGMKEGIMLTEEELALGMDDLKKGYTPREFELMLEEKNVPLSKWRDMARDELHVQEIIREKLGGAAQVSPGEIQQYYQSHLEEFAKPEMVLVRHIVTDTEEKAKELRHKVMAGENFAKMAIMHSLSPDRSKGGELGPFARGTHPKEFDTCFNLLPGEVSPVIKSPYGFHLFKLIEKNPKGSSSLAEARQEIASHLAQEKLRKEYDAWFEEIKAGSQIQVIEEELDKMVP
ncbi:MAG: peptidyl-prolyl cis-trans isomerase [Deltaproteobacteria bacterium]|nr:peptidyl-prolyl cis-trans isomerase [Deltaproteobacteria bacterium]